jgi:MFS family permease
MTGPLRRLRDRLHAGSATGFDPQLIVPMILGAVLNPINSSIIAVSLVPIGIAFGAPPATTAWLVSGLYLATAIGQPVVGRLVDSFGPRALYLAGATMTGIAGVLGVLAPQLWVLVLARVILGFGTCAGYPSAMYLIRSESRRTGRDSPATILTLLSISAQTTVVIGPVLGGLLIGLGGWRLTFAINIPLALACLWLGALRLPRRSPDAPRLSVRSLDVPGMALFAAALVSLLLFLMSPHADRWYLPVLAVLLAVGFGWRELRCGTPFLDLRVFGGNGPLLRTYARTVLASTVAYAVLYGFTQWLEDGRGLSASAAGLLLLPMPLVAIAISALTGRDPRIKAKLFVSAAAQIAMAVVLLFLGGSSGIWLLVLVVVLVGIPQGMANLANQNAVYFQADPERIGASAGLLRTAAYLGALISSAANGFFFTPTADTPGLHDLAIFLIVVSSLFALLTLLDRALSRVVPPTPAKDR